VAQVELISEVTGSVWKILANVGDVIPAEEPVMIIESMKMEIPVESEKPGKIIEILVSEGEQVSEGQVVAKIEV